jgi:DNA-binding MarR family transcriptional regulator
MERAAATVTSGFASRDQMCDSASMVTAGGAVVAIAGDMTAAPAVSARLVEMMWALRKDRSEQFPGMLGTDSCWDVLLALYAAHLNQHRLNISKLQIHIGIPPTTVLRSIAALAEAGLVVRTADRLDSRRVIVELSPSGVAAMNRYFHKTGLRAVLV